jgi:hypothetical protein
MTQFLARDDALILANELEVLVENVEMGHADEGTIEAAERLVASLEAAPWPSRDIDQKVEHLKTWTELFFSENHSNPAGPGSLKSFVLKELNEFKSLITDEV